MGSFGGSNDVLVACAVWIKAARTNASSQIRSNNSILLGTAETAGPPSKNGPEGAVLID